MKSFFPDFSLFVFSILICALVFFLTIKPQKIIDLLGSVLTPLLLLSLGVLVTVGIFWAPIVPLGSEGSGHYFQQGIFLGYQTMDLSAALLFATMVLPHLSGGTNDPKVVRRRMIQASLIASGLLMAVYVGLAWIAARHCGDFGQVSPEDLLQSISVKILGPFGGIVSSVAVFLACFTTAISLASVFAGYVRQELFKNRFGNGVSLCITLGFTALIANMGFRGIIGLWGPLLTVLYPLLIAICIYNIAKAPKNKSQFLHSP
jgi:LIVCS family branched-chain amino acid:cation transporter